MLSEQITRALDNGVSGTDILHSEMKNLMYEADQHLGTAQQIEDESGEAMDSMERTYAEGYLDALIAVNSLIVDLSYALEERTKVNG